MPVKKWLRQYAIAFPVLTGIFTLSQYVKGYTLQDSLSFALFWAVITLGIFAVTRMWNFHRNQYYALCNDLPENNNENQP
jgi:hypothetical protein